MAGAKIWSALAQIKPSITNPVLGIGKFSYYTAEFMENTMKQHVQRILLEANEATATGNTRNGQRMFLF